MRGCPEILGVYSRSSGQKAGRGASTGKGFVQTILWFVLRLDEDRCLMRPLNDKGLPGGAAQDMASADLARDFVPEPAAYRDKLFPVLASLRDKLDVLGGSKALPLLSPEEKLVLQALSVGHLLKAQADDVQVARLILAAAPSAPADFEARVGGAINAEGIGLRKRREYERSIAWFLKGLELSPGDDHLLFNLARAYYENGEAGKCRQCLERALEMNPGLAQARRFLEFLNATPRPEGKGGNP